MKTRSDAIDLDRVRDLFLQGYTRHAIAHAIGKSVTGVWGAIKRLGIHVDPVEDAHGLWIDDLCETGEPDRRATVYAMVCNGLNDDEIVSETGCDPTEVAKFRSECPKWWKNGMLKEYECGTGSSERKGCSQ